MFNATMRLTMILAGVCLVFCGCKTSEPGVKSSMFAQYTTLEATTTDTTDAAADVLKDFGLHDVESSATNLDGWAKGKMANNTPVNVSVRRVGEKLSDISVKVGSFGDPSLGKEIIARVRNKLGLKPPIEEMSPNKAGAGDAVASQPTTSKN